MLPSLYQLEKAGQL
ncbi:hypothetical protein ACVXHB_01925 [Escherichia coli]